MSENERLAAVLRLLPAWVLASDDRLVSRDESDILQVLGEDLAAIFPTTEPEDVILGAGTLFYVLDVALSRATAVAGMTRAELAMDIARRIAILNFGQDA